MFRKTRVYKRKRANKLAKRELLKCSLVALLIGAIGTGGSFAWFTSHKEVTSNLTVTTGSIKVEVLDRVNNPIKPGAINIIGLHPLSNGTSNVSGSSEFNIKNTGSLNQKVNLSLEYTDGIKDPEFLKNFTCAFTFKQKGAEESYTETTNMDELITKSKKINLKDILKNQEEIECKVQVTLNPQIDRRYSRESVKFKLNVEANQVNKE